MDSSNAPRGSSPEDLVVYVEELAGPDDYWLSLTDAARVCRVQDVSIRRAIGRSVLPVRRQHAGQNKRTRLVRASDLAPAGFPIIDESAAITTEIGKVDILSIPRQQQQIVQDHQALLLRSGEILVMLTNYQQQVQVDLQRQQELFQITLQTTQEEQIRQYTTLERRIAQEQEQLQQKLAETSLHLSNEYQALHQKFVQEQGETLSRDEYIQKNLATLQTTLQEHQDEIQRQLGALVTAQQKLLNDHQQAIDTSLKQMEQETRTSLLDLEQRVSDRLQQVTQTFATQISHLQNVIQVHDAQLTRLIHNLTQTQQFSENLRQDIATSEQFLSRILQQQQIQIDQHEQLLPLLPYTQQRLATEQDMVAWSQSLADLETRLLAIQKHDQSLQPWRDFLSPERLEILLRLTTDEENSSTTPLEKKLY